MNPVRNLRHAATWSLMVFCLPLLLAGCGGGRRAETPPDNNRPGMTRGQKTAMLVGAAALYYVYKTHQQQKDNAPANVRAAVPDNVQLYRSESTGAIYYREPNNPQKVHWLTLPQNRIEVPQEDYDRIMQQRNEWEGMQVPTAGSPSPSQL